MASSPRKTGWVDRFVRHEPRPGVGYAEALVVDDPKRTPLRALSQAPLSTLAQLARISPEQLRERLAQAGVSATTDQQSLSEIAGNDMRKQISLLGAVFGEAQ